MMLIAVWTLFSSECRIRFWCKCIIRKLFIIYLNGHLRCCVVIIPPGFVHILFGFVIDVVLFFLDRAGSLVFGCIISSFSVAIFVDGLDIIFLVVFTLVIIVVTFLLRYLHQGVANNRFFGIIITCES